LEPIDSLNPSFEIIAPLLSRSRVFVLQSLEGEALEEVVKEEIKELFMDTTNNNE